MEQAIKNYNKSFLNLSWPVLQETRPVNLFYGSTWLSDVVLNCLDSFAKSKVSWREDSLARAWFRCNMSSFKVDKVNLQHDQQIRLTINDNDSDQMLLIFAYTAEHQISKCASHRKRAKALCVWVLHLRLGRVALSVAHRFSVQAKDKATRCVAYCVPFAFDWLSANQAFTNNCRPSVTVTTWFRVRIATPAITS